jgi:hypothetical protein
MSSRIRYATVVSLSIVGLSLVAACGSPTKSTASSSGAAPVVTSDGSAGTGTSTPAAAAPACPSAGAVSTAMGSTYTGPMTTTRNGVTVCDYSRNSDTVVVVFYPTAKQMLMNIGISAPHESVSGFGNSAFLLGGGLMGYFYVERSATQSFSVVDPYATNAQVQAVARAVLGG